MGDKFFFKPIGSTGDWKPVVRYDNAHEFAHRDLLDPSGRLVKKTAIQLGTLAEVVEFAEQDLIDRSDWYIEAFLRMRRPQ